MPAHYLIPRQLPSSVPYTYTYTYASSPSSSAIPSTDDPDATSDAQSHWDLVWKTFVYVVLPAFCLACLVAALKKKQASGLGNADATAVKDPTELERVDEESGRVVGSQDDWQRSDETWRAEGEQKDARLWSRWSRTAK